MGKQLKIRYEAIRRLRGLFSHLGPGLVNELIEERRAAARLEDRHASLRGTGVLILALSVFAPWAAAAQAPTPAQALLTRSIAYHDPADLWSQGSFVFDFGSTRPDGPAQSFQVTIDNARGAFHHVETVDGAKVEQTLADGECSFRVDGSTEYSDEQAKAFGLSCDRLTRRRNYYTYLWGLPMKLHDPGTRIDPEVKADSFNGREALALKVTYDESVGSDIWYFYFDPATAALIGYRFFHDEAANDGEYITLADETELRVDDRLVLRLPKERTWYTHQGDKLLGTDTLERLVLSRN